MADRITISLEQIQDFKAKTVQFLPAVQAKVDKFLNKHALAIALKAKQKAPVNEGTLQGQISADISAPLEKHIVANTPYAAFIEFGTGKFAASYVATLPSDWQTFASQFKGQKGGGTFEEMVKRLAEWIRQKGLDPNTALHGTYSVKTRKRTGNKKANADADLALAYIIARSILINGIHAQPYLYPSYAEELEIMKAELPNILK